MTIQVAYTSGHGHLCSEIVSSAIYMMVALQWTKRLKFQKKLGAHLYSAVNLHFENSLLAICRG